MYYVFGVEHSARKNHIVQAKLTNYGVYISRGKNRQYVDIPDTVPNWWNCEPLTESPPLLSFEIMLRDPLLDNYFTGTIFDLYSERLINILESKDIRFETFPAIVKYKNAENTVPVLYKLFHLLECYDVIDKNKSDIGLFEVKKLVLNEETMKSNKLLFRIKDRPNITLIHEEIKTVLEQNKITGCIFTKVDEFQISSTLRSSVWG